jgi:hypothetical protein
MTENLCYCNFWTGRAAVHHRREGCTSETEPTPNTVMAEIVTSVNAAAQPFMTALTEVVHDTMAHLEAAIRANRERS